jgi:hypothetical protein
MDKLKRVAPFLPLCLLLIGAIVVTDYYGWLLPRPEPYTQYVTGRFMAKDSATDELIHPVFASCVAPGTIHACTQSTDAKHGEIVLKFALSRVRNRGLFFYRESPVADLAAVRVPTMFIHADYQRKVETVIVNELALDDSRRTVYLTRGATGE